MFYIAKLTGTGNLVTSLHVREMPPQMSFLQCIYQIMRITFSKRYFLIIENGNTSFSFY